MELPKWNDWTIDMRLRQFRKVESDENGLGHNIKFVDFNSDEGHEIFKSYCEDTYNYYIEEGSAYQRILLDLEEGNFYDEDAECLAQDMVRGTQ